MEAMVGEWTGNVRSTPTPKLTLRTVKVSCTPPPWRFMTAPWNTWTRSRVPSTTRTWTLTVSPGRNSGMSSRRLSRSIMSVGFMGRVFPRIVRVLRSPGTLSQRPQRSTTDSGLHHEDRALRPQRGSPIVAVIAQEAHLVHLDQERYLLWRQSSSAVNQVGALPEGSGQ